MFNVMTTKGGLAATTALVAVGAILVTPQGRSLLTPPADLTQPETVVIVDELGADAEGRQAGSRLGNEQVTTTEKVATPTETDSNLARRERADLGLADADTSASSDDGFASGQIAQEPVLEMEALEESFALDQSATQNRAQDQPAVSGIVAASPEAKRIIVPSDQVVIQPEGDTEAYSNAPDNTLKVTTDEPVSTFSIDVDTASYAVVRSSLTAGYLPPRDAVRVEEMVNYFTYDYPAPDLDSAPFSTSVAVSASPWNPDTRLVRIGLQGALPDTDTRPPLNLVFLIDTSGSMQDANKLPLLKQAFRLMISELRAEDQVAIVTYAGSAGTALEPTPARDRARILDAIDRLHSGGSTAGQAGLRAAYALAEQMSEPGDVSRILLATDGDFNVGISDPDALEKFVETQRAGGAYLSVLGFGRGNYRDDMMQRLAQNGNGTAAYIDTLAEAQKVLVDQLTGALFPIANDVKIQVEWNPALVGEYRLIGYETRALNREDFNNDKVDAGEIGAGHQVTALYEVTPTGSPALLNDPLRYAQAEATETASETELGFLKLRYKRPGEATSQLIETPISDTDAAAPDWAAAVAGFAQLLKGSDYTGSWTFGDAIALAEQTRGDDPHGLRAEAIRLMKLAESLN